MADGGNNQSGPNGNVTALVPQSPDGDGGISFARFVPKPPFDDRLVLWRARNSTAASGFRLLRQRLIERGDPRILLCTSPLSAEGKTTVAVNLAVAFAELGKHRVLILETDFRGPALGEVFGFKPPRGFAGQLAKHRTQPNDPWVVVQIATSQLYVLAAEPRCCPHCAAVMARDAAFCGMCGKQVPKGATVTLDAVTFAAAMRRFRDAFDYVIVDAPPVLSSGDVNLIQDAADAIVFAGRKGKSEARDLRRAIDHVAPLPVAAVALLEE